MKLHLPKTLLAAVLALAPCAAGATTYGWDSGAPTISTDGSATTAIDYPATAINVSGDVIAAEDGPLFYTQNGAITSLSASGYDVKLQLDDSGLSGALKANSLWLTGDKVFTAGTGTGQAQITTNALYLVGSQMQLTSSSSTALQNVGEIFIGWMNAGSFANQKAAIYATDTTEIKQNITVVDSSASGAGLGGKITVQRGKTLTIRGNINAAGRTLVVTGYDDIANDGILELSGANNNIGDFYLSGKPSGYDGPGYGVQLLLSSGKTTINHLHTDKVHKSYDNGIKVAKDAELVLTGTISTDSRSSDYGSSYLEVNEGGALTFSENFSGELNSHLSLRGSGTVSNAGTLSISGSVSLSKAIENTGTINLKNGASFDLGGLILIPVADITETSLQNATYTFVNGGNVTREAGANIAFTLGGATRTDLQWLDNSTGVYDSSVKVYNIAAGESQTYSNISTAFAGEEFTTGEIYVFGTLEALNTAPAYAVKGTGIVEITGDVTLGNAGQIKNANLQQFAGTIQIKSGTLKLDNKPDTIKAVDHVEVFTGGTLQAWSTTVDKNIILKGGILKASFDSVWKGDIEVQSASELQSPTGSAKISGDITGNGAITKTGDGTLTTTGNVSLANTLTVSAGTMEVAGETTFESGYSKEGTGKLNITGHAIVSENATVKLNETTLAESTATFSGKGAVQNAGTKAASVTLKDDFKGELAASSGALSAQWENANSTGKSLALASATGGDLTITSVEGGITITDIVIGAGRTVGVYTGDTTSSSSRISLQGNLTAGEGSVLDAGLSTISGSASLTLNSSLDLGGNSLFILNTMLSGDVLNWTNGDSITLFTNVSKWGEYDLETLDSIGDISWIFSNVGEWDNQYNYTLSSGTGGSVILNRTATPEPTTATLSLLALVGLCARRRRRK